MAEQSIDELLTQLGRPEYARTFAHIASHSPVTINNGQAYRLTARGVTPGTPPSDPQEFKTLYFALDDEHGPYLAGLVLALEDRVDWHKAAQALGTHSQALVDAEYATAQLPSSMSAGNCGPFFPDGYAHRAKLRFDERALYSDAQQRPVGWRLPGCSDTEVYTQGVEPVFASAARVADATHAAIRKV